MPVWEEPILSCGLCERPFQRRQLTKHHCKPKSKGGTTEDVELICSPCHGMVHATYTNNTLAAVYPTLVQLRQAPELQSFLTWLSKQAPTSKNRNKPRRRNI